MHIIVVISRGLKHRIANISGNMDLERRSTKKYRLISPKLDELKSLISLVSDPVGFTARYGALVSLLTIKMEEGLLLTLIQFYDPVYHCFTFLDPKKGIVSVTGMRSSWEYSSKVGINW